MRRKQSARYVGLWDKGLEQEAAKLTPTLTETDHSTEGEARREGGEGEIRANSRQDAQEEGREIEAQGEAQQASELMSETMAS